MRALGWMTVARRFSLASWLRRGQSRRPAARKNTSPAVEALESIDLLSVASMGFNTARSSKPTIAALGSPVTPTSISIQGSVKASATQTTSLQTAVVPSTLTNFTLPFNPSLNLFDSALGQLVSVRLTATATLNSQIISQNLSTTTGADITGFTNGTYNINGLPTTINGSLNGTTATVTVPPLSGPPDFTGPSTVTFPPLVSTDTRSITYTSASDLSFFTASTGRTTITPQLVAQAVSGADAPNGNLQTDVRTLGSGQISVVYDYIPRCPSVVSLVRFGLHHQPTQLQLTFDGPVVPSDATNTANYRIVVPNKYGHFTGPGVRYIPVTSAVYNPADNTVLLTTSRPLNVHKQFQLEINLPCNDGNSIIIQFGGKRSFGGYTGHNGQFIPYANGRVLRRV